MNHNILEFTNFSHSYQEMNVIKRIMNKNVLFIDLMKVKTNCNNGVIHNVNQRS